MSAPRFIHLRLHSAYSLLEGAIPVRKLAELCKADGMPAVALTDTGNLFAALEFSEAMAKAGVQPIMGCQLALAYAELEHPGDRAPGPAPGAMLHGRPLLRPRTCRPSQAGPESSDASTYGRFAPSVLRGGPSARRLGATARAGAAGPRRPST